MDASDTTANNADLWSHYLHQQWAAFLDPFGLGRLPGSDAATRTLADVAAANVASVLAVLLAPPVARLYRSNAQEVTQAMRDMQIAADDPIEIPEPYLARRPQPQFEIGQPIEPIVVSAPAQESVIAY